MTGQKSIIHLGKEQTFENYFVCEENQIAYAAAKSIAKSPGNQFNPYILYGSTGLGKTHLLKAISNEIKITRPELKVTYTTTNEIIDKYISSIRNNNPDELYKNYIDTDILLIDEFESIYNIPETQRELIKIINWLLAEKKQVVISACKILKECNSVIQTIQNKWGWSFFSELW